MRWLALIGGVSALAFGVGHVVERYVPKPPPAIAETRSGQRVEFVVEVEGCRVYRFDDRGYTRYLTTCPGKVKGRTSAGKSTRHDEIETVTP